MLIICGRFDYQQGSYIAVIKTLFITRADWNFYALIAFVFFLYL